MLSYGRCLRMQQDTDLLQCSTNVDYLLRCQRNIHRTSARISWPGETQSTAPASKVKPSKTMSWSAVSRRTCLISLPKGRYRMQSPTYFSCISHHFAVFVGTKRLAINRPRSDPEEPDIGRHSMVGNSPVLRERLPPSAEYRCHLPHTYLAIECDYDHANSVLLSDVHDFRKLSILVTLTIMLLFVVAHPASVEQSIERAT